MRYADALAATGTSKTPLSNRLPYQTTYRLSNEHAAQSDEEISRAPNGWPKVMGKVTQKVRGNSR
jgi:hypothetical protein